MIRETFGMFAYDRCSLFDILARQRFAPLWRHDRVLFLVSGILVRRFRFGATMALGRSMIMMLRPLRRRRWSAISYGVIDNRSENLQH